MLPITREVFERLGAWVNEVRADPRLREWAQRVMLTERPRSVIEAADLLAPQVPAAVKEADDTFVVYHVAAIAAAGIAVTMEGRSLASPEVIDAIDVLVLDQSGWVPTGDSPYPPKEPVAIHKIRYLA